MAYTTIDKSTDHFTTTLWTGDSTTPKTFTTGTFKPDWLWGKNRSQAYAHQLYDTTRGAGNDKEIVSNSNGAEGASNPETYGYVSAFTSTGFTATRGTDSAGDDYWNESPDNYVAWSWKANGGTTSSNSDGSITSTVQANTTAGFSIVKYTGTGSNATVGHGLGNTPDFIIIKSIDSAYNWVVWTKGFSTTQRLLLDTTDAITTGNWNTLPTSSVFGLGTQLNINKSGDNFIAYCFTEKVGYSKVGSYTGSGNADGPFIYTGFRPAFILRRETSNADAWIINDTKRNPINNGSIVPLYPNAANAEPSGINFDFLSNGFKIRNTDGDTNTSGATYTYMAFGQTIVGSNNVPCTAR